MKASKETPTLGKNMASSSSSPPHFVIFPFMSKGHTIPLLHLARLLTLRNITVTIFTTPSNSPFISQTLVDTNVSIIDLPFPDNIPGLPPGIESTDKLPSLSAFIPFAKATKLLQPEFERVLPTLPFVSCLISDGFLGWTLESATKFGIPRLVSYGMTIYPMVVGRAIRQEYPNLNVNLVKEPLSLKSFPWIKIDRDENLGDGAMKLGHPWYDFTAEQIRATSKSSGILLNTFYELESTYVDYWNREYQPKAWCLGPLCLARVQPLIGKPSWMHWLDSRKGPVLYIAFGSQANVPIEQLKAISIGLERSNMNFLWVMRSKELTFDNEFCERVKDRGLVVTEWVDQTEILRHESVRGFISHCGWNSVLESICASVPVLAWPMMADQFLNAKMVEELGIGFRIPADKNGGNSNLQPEKLEQMVRELMLGEKGKETAIKVKNYGEAASRAMEEGGSSKRSLDLLINEVCCKRPAKP